MKRDDFYDTSNANSHNSTPSPRGKLMDHLSGFRFVGSAIMVVFCGEVGGGAFVPVREESRLENWRA